MNTEPQGWGQRHYLVTSFTGLSTNAFYLIFASSSHLSSIPPAFVGSNPLHELLFFDAREFIAVFEEGTRKHDTSIAEPINQGWAVLVCQLSYLGSHTGLSSLYFLWKASRCRGKWFEVHYPSIRDGVGQECTQATNILMTGKEKGITEHILYTQPLQYSRYEFILSCEHWRATPSLRILITKQWAQKAHETIFNKNTYTYVYTQADSGPMAMLPFRNQWVIWKLCRLQDNIRLKRHCMLWSCDEGIL